MRERVRALLNSSTLRARFYHPAFPPKSNHSLNMAGLFHCLNAKSGDVYWTHDLFAAC